MLLSNGYILASDCVDASRLSLKRALYGETTADPGGSAGARERAHPRLRKFFNVQTIFKHVSMCVRNLLGACIDASAAVQRLCPYMPCACVASPCTFHM